MTVGVRKHPAIKYGRASFAFGRRIRDVWKPCQKLKYDWTYVVPLARNYCGRDVIGMDSDDEEKAPLPPPLDEKELECEGEVPSPRKRLQDAIAKDQLYRQLSHERKGHG